ncbi:MAG: hypothetical protein J6P98_04490 [Clostridia bacterium]|nr:hypothetical protein [Clostridia bacterium]
MKNSLRKLAGALALAFVFCLCAPVFALETADHDAHDVEKLRAFFTITGNSPYSNGRAINGEGFDINDPATWTACAWDEAGRLRSLEFDNLGWEVVGELDLSDCTGLELLVGTDCQISALNVSGCSSLKILDVTGNRLTSISVEGLDELETLWFKQNSVSELDVSGNAKLRSLDCSNNAFSELDVSHNPLLNVLRCSNNSISELDLSANPLLTELNVKTNLLTEIDISHLSGLVKFISFNNRFRRLDISVLNGGMSYVLEAVGNGYVGTKVYTDSDGNPVTHGSSNPADGESFLGWFEANTLISDSEHCPCAFGAPGGMQAHFTGEVEPQLQLGDVDANGSVNSADALLLMRYVMHLVTENDLHLEVADVTGEGSVNSVDSLNILRMTLGLM